MLDQNDVICGIKNNVKNSYDHTYVGDIHYLHNGLYLVLDLHLIGRQLSPVISTSMLPLHTIVINKESVVSYIYNLTNQPDIATVDLGSSLESVLDFVQQRDAKSKSQDFMKLYFSIYDTLVDLASITETPEDEEYDVKSEVMIPSEYVDIIAFKKTIGKAEVAVCKNTISIIVDGKESVYNYIDFSMSRVKYTGVIYTPSIEDTIDGLLIPIKNEVMLDNDTVMNMFKGVDNFNTILSRLGGVS